MRDRFKTKTFQSALKPYAGGTDQVFKQTIDRLGRDCYCCIEPRRYSAVMFYELPIDVVQSQNHPDMNAILKYLPSWPTPDMTETPDYDRYFISKQDEKKINAALKTLYQNENKKTGKNWKWCVRLEVSSFPGQTDRQPHLLFQYQSKTDCRFIWG